MRYAKTLMILFLAATLVGIMVFTANEAMAKVGTHVQAVCSVCHTMHHSQHGTDPAYGWGDAGTSIGPNPALLYGNHSTQNNATCIACHTIGTVGTATNGYDDDSGAPQIDLAEATMLAGGSYGESAGDHQKVHNVLGLYSKDQYVQLDGTGNIPPGGYNDDIGGADQITCAGTTGCHGKRDISDNVRAVHGAHHTDDTTIDGELIGSSYRFLSTDAQGTAFSSSGAIGLEHSNWEANLLDGTSDTMNANADSHNVYYATDINLVCASCHGKFHGHTGTEQGANGPTDPWLRHPTDVSLASASASGPSTEYNHYPNVTDKEYSLEAPVGYASLTVPAVSKTEGIVLCLSCHRAHGSEYNDILRWDYDTMKATGGAGTVDTGCNACHTTK